MTTIIDKIILFVILFLFSITGTSVAYTIVPLLIIISFSCLFTVIENKIIRIIGMILYSFLCIFIQELTLFLPLLCYDFLLTDYQTVCLFNIFPIFFNIEYYSPFYLLTLIFAFFLAGLMKYKTKKLEKQQNEYIQYRDKSKEIAIDLENKNKELLQKQDYEINIARLNERNRIAMEIHDNVGHLLSSSILQVGAILATTDEASIKKNLEIINDTLSNAMNSIRESVHNLHDETLSLEPQIRNIINHFYFCPIDLDFSIIYNPNPQITYAIISILKESLANIMKHSNATNVKITIREHPSLYQLIIHDNGTNIAINTNGIGIKNMETRIYDLNGIFNIYTKNGFQIFISIPKKEDISSERFNH